MRVDHEKKSDEGERAGVRVDHESLPEKKSDRVRVDN